MSVRVSERRRRTADEIVAAATAVMTERGAAGLSLGQVASRMGMKAPSLYEYFPSKAALCDEIFAQGWHGVSEAIAPHFERFDHLDTAADLGAEIYTGLRLYVGWALNHSAMAELMFWRPIPAWHPSETAYGAAVQALDQCTSALRTLQEQGLVRRDADPDEMTSVLTILGAGVISQHLSNEPATPITEGRHSRHLATLATMFAAQYAAPRPSPLRKGHP